MSPWRNAHWISADLISQSLAHPIASKVRKLSYDITGAYALFGSKWMCSFWAYPKHTSLLLNFSINPSLFVLILKTHNCQRKKPSFVLCWFQSSQRPRKNSIFLVFFLVFSYSFLIFFKPNGGTLLGATRRVHKHALPLPLLDSQPGSATWYCK